MFLIALVVLINVLYVSYRSTKNSQESSLWVTHTHEVLSLYEKILADLSDMRASEQHYILTAEEESLHNRADMALQVDVDISRLRLMLDDHEEQVSLLDSLTRLTIQVKNYSRDLVLARSRFGVDSAQHLLTDGLAERTMLLVRRLTRKMEREELQLLKQRTANQEHAATQLDIYFLLLSILTLTALLVFYWISKRSSMRLVKLNSHLSDANEELKDSEGELRKHLQQITELQQHAQESEKKYRELVENAADMMYEFDANGKFTFVNAMLVKQTGYEREELLEKPYYELVHPDYREQVITFYKQQVAEYRQESYLEFPILSRKGTLWVGQNARLFFKDKRTLWKVSLVGRDITQRKQFELQLVEAKEKAEEAAKAKSLFLSMMSHEIRTPMNAIIGLTNWLIRKSPRIDQQESLDLLKFSSENLLTIINDILDFNKIEAGKLQLEYSSFDLRVLVNSIRKMLSQRADDKGIHLYLRFDDSLPEIVKGDPVRINQVLLNLLGNAIKFTEEGSVALTISPAGKEDNKYLIHFEVEDTGIGIPTEKIEFIFEGFSQAHANHKFGGTGLGLSISKRLVGMMGGEIQVISAPGNGSVFSFTIGLEEGKREDVITLAQQESTDDLGELPVKILLIDDNEVNQTVATNFLMLWGVQVDAALNGREGIELLKDKSYHLVLMDLQMPELNGFEATRIIRSMDDPYFKQIPIIALTASATNDVKISVLAVGMNDYVSKPFQPAELHATIGQYIPKGDSLYDAYRRDGIDTPLEEALADMVTETVASTVTPGTTPQPISVIERNHLKTIDAMDEKLFNQPAVDTNSVLTDGSQFFNLKRFKEVTFDKAAIQKKTAAAFILHTPPLLDLIETEIKNGNVKRVGENIHKLKASASLFCIDTLRDEIIYLEKNAEQVGQSDYNERAQIMIHNVSKLIEEVKFFNARL